MIRRLLNLRESKTLLIWGLPVLAGIAISLYISPASAYSPYLDQLHTTYNLNSNCYLCHRDRALNAFGKDFSEALKAAKGDPQLAFLGLEKLDTDGDGISNLDELRGQASPSDPLSQPQKKSQ